MADVFLSPQAVNSTEIVGRIRGRAQEQEDPKGAGQKLSLLNLAQPKNCTKEDLKKAKQKTREANTSRSGPKNRYCHNHFVCARFFILCLVDDDIINVEPLAFEDSVFDLHIHIPASDLPKTKHKPQWDVKDEREFEAANPGPADDSGPLQGSKDLWDYDKEGQLIVEVINISGNE